jgi:N utilization substance protein B
MGVRHEGREAAVQFLYQRDLGGGVHDTDLEDFYVFRGLSPAARRFCQQLAEGALKEIPKIDQLLEQHTQNYELGRLAAVDRNVLRLATYELLFCPETPPAVIINEAITIAKKYGTEESGRFVNGILDKIKRSASTSPNPLNS